MDAGDGSVGRAALSEEGDGRIGRRRLGAMVRVAVDAAGIGSAAVVLAVPLGRVWPWADVVGQFLVQALVALAVVAGLAAVCRAWRRAGGAVLLLVAALAWPLGGASWSPGSRAAPAAVDLRVLVANLHAPSGVLPADELAAWLADTGADVVLLNEAFGILYRQLPRGTVHFPHEAYCGGELFCETVILSALPLRDVEYRVDARHGGKVLLASIEVAGQPLTLGLTHVHRPIPPGSPAHNLRQSHFVADAAEGRERLILAGDFNAVPWGRVMAMFQDRLGLRGPVLWEGTWPAWLPVPLRLHIDHVLVACGLDLVEVRSMDFPRSDHLAVLASVAVIEEAGCG